MKRNSIGAVLLAALSFMLTTGARAQSMEEADVPFAFHAGHTELPAGHYLIQEDHVRHLIKISNLQTGALVVLSVQQSSAGGDKRVLRFHSVGGQRYLREICGIQDALNLTISPTKMEKEASSLRLADHSSPANEQVLVALK
jgi:hypothetical protein